MSTRQPIGPGTIGRHWQIYCENTSVHGIRYLGLSGLSWPERSVWTVIMTVAFVGVFNVSLLISERYQTSPLSTVVETTNYHVSEIAYPAITLCNNHRVDFNRMAEALERFLPNATQTAQNAFLALLKALEILDFGSFDELENLMEHNYQELGHLNLAEVAVFVSYRCEDLLTMCWWRNKYMACCDIFTMQKSEYGICLAFNSATSLASVAVDRSYAWPWRASSFNEWSALRCEFNVKQSRYLNASRPLGILIIVHSNYEWPNIARFMPSGTTTSVGIKATSFYASAEVRALSILERGCIYQDETYSQSDLMFLQGLPYLRPNCIAECRQRHMIKYCNCTLEFFYSSGVYPICDVNGLVCMNQYNDIFNYEVPPKKNEYFNEDEDGMLCNCLPECDRVEYITEVQPNLAMATKSNDTITLDIHFISGEMVRYRTDITFGWLDLMVAFGGVAGLFLGCSLLSGVEMVYYLTIGLFYQMKRNNGGSDAARHTAATVSVDSQENSSSRKVSTLTRALPANIWRRPTRGSHHRLVRSNSPVWTYKTNIIPSRNQREYLTTPCKSKIETTNDVFRASRHPQPFLGHHYHHQRTQQSNDDNGAIADNRNHLNFLSREWKHHDIRLTESGRVVRRKDRW